MSTARWQTPLHVAYVAAVLRDPLNPAVTISITKAPVNCPKPYFVLSTQRNRSEILEFTLTCIAKTEPIMAPLHLVVANLKFD